MTICDHGRRKPRTAIAAPTMANQPAISTKRAGSMTRSSVARPVPGMTAADGGAATVASGQAGPAVANEKAGAR